MLEQKLMYLQKVNCTKIGTILKLHSFKGQVIVKSDFDFIENTEEPVFVEIDNFLVPFFVDNKFVKYLHDNSAIIKFSDIDNEIDAQKLINKNIYFPTELLIINEEELSIFSDFVGFIITDKKYGDIGVIDEIIEIPNNPLFQVRFNSKEVLIPINGIEIIEKNTNSKKLFVNLPEGILDI